MKVFGRLLRDAWGKRVRGSPTFKLSQKLVGLKGELRRWNREVVGDTFVESKRVEGEISDLHVLDEKQGLRRLSWRCRETKSRGLMVFQQNSTLDAGRL